jgi:hypothetical protein
MVLPRVLLRLYGVPDDSRRVTVNDWLHCTEKGKVADANLWLPSVYLVHITIEPLANGPLTTRCTACHHWRTSGLVMWPVQWTVARQVQFSFFLPNSFLAGLLIAYSITSSVFVAVLVFETCGFWFSSRFTASSFISSLSQRAARCSS